MTNSTGNDISWLRRGAEEFLPEAVYEDGHFLVGDVEEVYGGFFGGDEGSLEEHGRVSVFQRGHEVAFGGTRPVGAES